MINSDRNLLLRVVCFFASILTQAFWFPFWGFTYFWVRWSRRRCFPSLVILFDIPFSEPICLFVSSEDVCFFYSFFGVYCPLNFEKGHLCCLNDIRFLRASLWAGRTMTRSYSGTVRLLDFSSWELAGASHFFQMGSALIFATSPGQV